MNFLSVLYAKAGITVDGVTTLNNTATGQTPATNDNSTKLATTGYVKNQNYYPYPTGTTAQYVRGDGSLATFTQTGGGGSSVSYYLNGSVSQGTIGGNAYYEMSKNAIIGTNADFTINANGYVAQFVTDAGDPALLNIPGGNWNFEMFFSASSGGGSPSFYVELYKYNGTTLTLIASGSAIPESITGGTSTDLYVTALAVPTTTLTLTDRLAVRVYVTHSGRTITLHTQDSHLCQVITTFTTGLTALNGLTAQVQNFAVGAGGTDFNISSVTDTHTFNLPTASATKRGALSSIDWSAFDAKVDFGDLSATAPLNYNGSGLFTIAQSSGSTNGYLSSTDWTTFNAKQNAITLTTTGTSGAATLVGATLNIPNYITDLSGYVPYTGATANVNLGVYSLTASGLSVINNSLGSGRIYIGSATNYIYGNNTSYIYIGNSGGDRLTITNNGAAIFSNSVTAGGLIEASYDGARIQVTSTTNSTFSAFRLGAKNSSGVAKNAGLYFVSGTTTANTYLSLIANDSTFQFNFFADGNFAINSTTNAGYKLDVNGTARINGVLTLLAEDWHKSTDDKLRLYFATNGITYVKGDGLEFRNNTDVPLLSLASGGAATFVSNIGWGGVTPIGNGTTSSTIESHNGAQIAARISVPQLYIGSNVSGTPYAPTRSVTGYAVQLSLDAFGGTISLNRAVSAAAGTAITWISNLGFSNTGAATFSSSVTATNGYISASYNAGDPIIWGGIAPYANIYGALSWDIDKAIVKGKGGYGLGLYVDDNITKGITIATTGAATFSNIITAINLTTKSGDGASAWLLKDTSGTNKWEIGHYNNDLYFYSYGSSTVPFIINDVSGATTITNLAGTGDRMVVADASGVLSTQAIPSGGGITGSGTTNYITKWTGGTAIGDSSIYDNGTYVGIGTTIPAYKLQVRPSATFGNSEDGNISIWASQGGGTVTNPTSVGGIIFGDENTLNSYQGRIAVISNNPSATTASHMRFYTNAGGGNSATAERMRIASSGNLLIGTTTDAGYKLDVNGTARVSGKLTVSSDGEVARIGASSTNMYVALSANSVDVGYIGNGVGTVVGATATDLGIQAPQNFVIATGGSTERFRIASTGAATFSSSVSAASFNGQLNGNYYSGGTYAFEGLYGSKSTSNGGALIQLLGHATASTANGFAIRYDTDVSSNLLFQYAGTQSTLGALSYTTIFSLNNAGSATFSSSITATNGIFNNAAGGSIGLKYGGTDDWVVGENAGAATRDFNIYNFNRTSIELSISRATGTATFNGRISTPVGWTTVGRNYSHEWIEFPYNSGLYSPINSAHFYPNDGSYGAWKINGARNGYNGLEFGALTNGSVSLMIDINSNGSGFYNNTYGSQLFWSAGELQISKNNYGGGLIVAVLDAVNFNTYLDSSYLSLSGGTITGDLTVNNKVYIGTHGCYFQEVLISGVYELQVVDSAGNITVIS